MITAMTSLRVRRHHLPLWALVLTVVAVALPAIATSRAQGAATGCTVTYTTGPTEDRSRVEAAKTWLQ